MGDLAGKIALVTGGGSGIGLAIAETFAASGATVVIAGRSESKLRLACEEIGEYAGEVTALPCDVGAAGDVATLFSEISSRFGALDILVNNAGTLTLGAIDEIEISDWDRVFTTNVRGAFLCSRSAFKIMKPRQSGRIINIGSLSARRVRQKNAAYCASKFALDGMTQCLALEGRAHGISCGIIHPGNTASEITSSRDFVEPMMDARDVARAALLMATLPMGVTMLETVIMPVNQHFLGRG